MAEEKLIAVACTEIKVGGKDIPADVLATLESVEFEEELNTCSAFTLRFSTSDFTKGDWQYLDLDTFQLGKELSLSMGNDAMEPMVTGEIVSLEPSFSGGVSGIEVRGYDRLHRLRFGRWMETYTDKTDGAIAEKIAGKWKLSAKVEDTGVVYPYVCQDNKSDIEFLLERAGRIGYELMVEDKTLCFRRSKENEAPSLSFEYGKDIHELSVNVNAPSGGSELIVQSWDVKNKKAIYFKASDGSEISKMSGSETGASSSKTAFGASASYIVDELVMDASDAEKLAIAKYNEQISRFLTGEGKCPGNPLLRAGSTIEVLGIGKFSGVYYVTSTKHVADNDGYCTSFTIRRTAI